MPIETEYLNGRKPDQEWKGELSLLDCLIAKKVDVVVDVRLTSLHPAYFIPEALKRLCLDHNMLYLNCHHLGNPQLNRNLNNIAMCQELYRHYIMTTEKDCFDKLVNIIQKNPDKTFCLVCVCQTQNRSKKNYVPSCHRLWLKEMLESVI